MPLESRKTFKIESLPELTLDGFNQELRQLAGNGEGHTWEFGVGLSVHTENGERMWVGTVSCQTREIKKKMMDNVKRKIKTSSQWTDVRVDDNFPGLTVLHTPLDGTEPEAK
jgi:hypothetical protein